MVRSQLEEIEDKLKLQQQQIREKSIIRAIPAIDLRINLPFRITAFIGRQME